MTVRIGVIGCGAISPAYFNGIKPYANVEITAVADLDLAKAEERAKEFDIDRVLTVDALIADPAIDLVLNLTVPKAHAPINLAALKAGKHAYCEKPYALSTEEGKEVLDYAAAHGLMTGCAPDTFLGGGIQTARHYLDQGAIGKTIAGTAFMCCHGHESWHPSPEFYYEKGGGPMFDMGPYYLTALVNLLGPVTRVTGSTAASFPTRTITSQPKNGKVVPVETPTHQAAVLDFASGAIMTVIQSFDIWAHHLPVIELYGTEGTMTVPDPNGFGGQVTIHKPGGAWEEQVLTHSVETSRGYGLADMAKAITDGRPARVSGELAYHVLEVMAAVEAASDAGKHIVIASSPDRPAPVPAGIALGELD